MKKPQKPKKPSPAKLLLEYVADAYSSGSRASRANFKTTFPCPICEGRAYIRDERQRCPIDGLKMADWIVCTKCTGNGLLAKGVLVAHLMEKATKHYVSRLNCYQREMADWAMHQSIIARLSPKQKKWLSNRMR